MLTNWQLQLFDRRLRSDLFADQPRHNFRDPVCCIVCFFTYSDTRFKLKRDFNFKSNNQCIFSVLKLNLVPSVFLFEIRMQFLMFPS